MGWFGVRSAASRRTMVTVLVAGFTLTAAGVWAQEAPAAPAAAPAQEAAPPPPPDPFKFTTDAAVMIFTVKADQTAAFEDVWGQIRGRLAASEKPDLRSLGESLSVYRVPGSTDQGASYFVVADPASKTLSYSPSPFLLFEAGLFEDAEARALFEKLNGALNGISPAGVNYAAAPIAPPPPPPPAPEGAPAEGAAPPAE